MSIEDDAVAALVRMRRLPSDIVTLNVPRPYWNAAGVNLSIDPKTHFMDMNPTVLMLKAAAAGVVINVIDNPDPRPWPLEEHRT